MKRIRKSLFALLCFTGIILGSCSIDKSYDLGENIDMTMGLGSNGLALKLGNVEKIYLRDILKVEDSAELDTLQSGAQKSLYYLVKEGNSNFSMTVDKIKEFGIPPVKVIDMTIYTPSTTITIPAGSQNIPEVELSGSNNVNITMDNIPAEVTELRAITLNNWKASLALTSSNKNVSVKSTTPVVFRFPNFIFTKKEGADDNDLHTYTFPIGSSGTFEVQIDSIVLPKTGKFGQMVVNHTISVSGVVSAKGTFKAVPTTTVTLQANVPLNVNINSTFPNVTPNTVSGIFDPAINPTTDPIKISNDLPSFLTDKDVALDIANPTIALECAGDRLPVSLTCYADLKSKKSTTTISSVRVPVASSASIKKGVTSVNYFYQSAAAGPFLPKSTSYPSSTYLGKYVVPTLSSLVLSIPDEIGVDLSTGHVATDKSALQQVTLGQTYGASIKYTAYIPLTFNGGLKIVYTDSVAGMNKDMKNYQADSIAVTATAYNTVPLALAVDVEPMDVNGNVISGIIVTPAVVAAGTGDIASPATSEVKIKMTATNRALVSKIEKLRFRVKGSARDKANGDPLMSTQYIELKNLRIRLLGQIVGNFN